MRVHADELADNSHGGKNHDVHRGMAVEPEEVLIQNWIATHGWIKDSDIERALNNQQKKRDAQHWRRKNLNNGRGINGPQEQRHAEPRHSRRTQFVHGDNEI